MRTGELFRGAAPEGPERNPAAGYEPASPLNTPGVAAPARTPRPGHPPRIPRHNNHGMDSQDLKKSCS
ncbi:unnamed protein product [Coccothraustes coccothraustes]